MTQTLDNTTSSWGSDLIAETLQALDLRYIALNPGSSYRGLHDSLVNHTENNPELLLCVHEEAAVAIAHGYAKITGRPMGVALHSNVGLMHGSMSIYNAWCDRVPILIMGATGAVDTVVRRNWIDWMHTSRDQGALIRNFVKWDDQPASPGAAVEVTYRPPPEIPVKAGVVYFVVSTENNYWRNVVTDRQIAVYLPRPFDPQQTKVELLGIPRKG